MNMIPISLAPTSLPGLMRNALDSTATGMRRVGWMVASGYQRLRQRRALAQLDQHLLRDIGISAAQARQEFEKPFWR
jgi:uncharacterized protein YjiS (DUF1127 family)